MRTLADIKRRAVAGARLEVIEQTKRPVLVGTVRTIVGDAPCHRIEAGSSDRKCYDWANEAGEHHCTNWPKARNVRIIDADTFEYDLPHPSKGCIIRLRFLPMTNIDTAITEPTDRQFTLADEIELFLETTKLGTDWSPSQIAQKLHCKPQAYEVRLVLQWMENHVFIASNGRGGCWRRYGRRK